MDQQMSLFVLIAGIVLLIFSNNFAKSRAKIMNSFDSKKSIKSSENFFRVLFIITGLALTIFALVNLLN